MLSGKCLQDAFDILETTKFAHVNAIHLNYFKYMNIFAVY